jgi:iron complex outermembrane receptor protein
MKSGHQSRFKKGEKMSSFIGRKFRAHLVCSAAILALNAGAALAENSGFSLPAQLLSQSLEQVSRQTGENILFTPLSVSGVRAPALKGQMSAYDAVGKLLRGTDLEAVPDGSDGLIIRVAAKMQHGEIVHPNVMVAQASSPIVSDGTTARMPQSANDGPVEAVVVTGTRVTGLTAADSPAPIVVLGSDALAHAGSDNLLQALGQTLPQFVPATSGGDLGNLTLTANLRGLSPNDTLVMVNGKRRHNTGNLNVGGGGAAPDLSMIPSAAIDHIEVLQDGAAAQYGTDAIAGVINIILKKSSSAGSLTATAGEYYAGGGRTIDVSANAGIPLFKNGYINLTVEKISHGGTQVGGNESHFQNALTGALLTPAQLGYDPTTEHNYPRSNYISGEAEVNQFNTFANAGYDINDDLTIYAFGNYNTKIAQSFENDRRANLIVGVYAPNRVQELGVSCGTGVGLAQGCVNTFSANALVEAPNGFEPKEGLRETDWSYAAGIKGKLAGWNFDLSSVFGKDVDNIYTLNSRNQSLFINTGFTPTNFYDGAFIATEWTTDLDVSRNFNVGLASPLNVAVGVEGRENTYHIQAGDAASYYFEGAQGYPGFTPNDIVDKSRKNYGIYLDLALAPIEALQLDGAVRYEHYTDFGDAKIAQFTARYDFNAQWAIRGTAGNGFRAPTLPEEYYTTTNVDPQYATVQLAADSPAAKVLGLQNLKPELSTNYSMGIIAHPLPKLSLTADAFSIAIGGRIAGSPTLYGVGGAINSPVVLNAIAANGNVTQPGVTQVGVSALLNGMSTDTKGVDITAGYPTDFGDFGFVNWTLAGTFNDTHVTHVPPTPAQLQPVVLFQPYNISNMNDGSKIVAKLSANWRLDQWSATFTETYYGPYFTLNSPNGGPPLYKEERASTGTSDLEFGYDVSDNFKVALGGRNILNKTPEFGPYTPTGALVNNGSSILNNPISTRYGTNGGYYYARISLGF